jgi:hypothetical protein
VSRRWSAAPQQPDQFVVQHSIGPLAVARSSLNVKGNDLPTYRSCSRPNSNWCPKALGLTIPDKVMALADEVIE